MAKAPAIDAALADPLWQRAPELQLHAAPGKEGKLATRVRLLFGETHLYAAIRCEEPDGEIHAKARKRDGDVWRDDCVELYVLPHPRVGYKQIAINPLGTVFDQSFLPGGRGDTSWNAKLKLAVAVRPGKEWTVALAAAYEDLGARAGRDQTWRFNVTRVRRPRGKAPGQEYTWALLPTAEFQQPDAFGSIEHVDIAGRSSGPAGRGEDGPVGGIRWTRLREVRGVRRCFAHPLDPRLAWCATTGGLWATGDGGRTWQAQPPVAPPAAGEVTCLALSACDPSVICLGTDAGGLRLSRDGGKTWRRLGGEGERPASAHVEWAAFCPSDPSGRTLLVTHGLAAPGISVSRDLGRTWEVLGRDRFLRRFVKRGETLIAAGSMIVTEGKVWGIHRSGTDGLRWEETVRGVRPSVPVACSSRWQFLAATLDGAILQSFDDGKSWRRLVASERSAWSSLFYTPASGAKGLALAAYDPYRQGLCLSRHGFANGLGERHNRGIYVGAYVKSGAACTANASGTVYYVAMNNALWVGRWAPPAQGPAIVEAWCDPCCLRVDSPALRSAEGDLHARIAAVAAGQAPGEHVRPIAAAARAVADAKARMGFTVRAVVRHRRGPGAIKTVAVDVARLAGGAALALHDDGKHDDGKARDGTFAARVRFDQRVFQRPDFRERLHLTVKATDTNGLGVSWPAVVNVPRGPGAVGLMRGGWDSDRAEGPVTVQSVRDRAVGADEHALRFTVTGPGAWRAAWLVAGDGVNSAGRDWLTFRIRGETDQDLLVHLVDHHKIGSEGFFDEPHFSAPVALVAGGYLKAITPAYQAVRIPIARLLPKGVFFLRWHTAGIGLSSPKGSKPATYHVDRVQLEP